MGRKIKAVNAETGQPVRVDLDTLGQGRIRHPDLSRSLLARLRAVHERLRGVYPLSLEQFEVSIMRDADPEGEAAVCERIADAFEKVTAALPGLDRKFVLRTLLAYSAGIMAERDRESADVRRIIEIAEPS